MSRVSEITIGILVALGVMFVTAETAMTIDTQEFMIYANKVFSHEVHLEDAYGENGQWLPYSDGINGDGRSYPDYDYSYILFRDFTWHDFQRGAIHVYYRKEHINRYTGEIEWSYGTDRWWYIEKYDGEWHLVGKSPIAL